MINATLGMNYREGEKICRPSDWSVRLGCYCLSPSHGRALQDVSVTEVQMFGILMVQFLYYLHTESKILCFYSFQHLNINVLVSQYKMPSFMFSFLTNWDSSMTFMNNHDQHVMRWSEIMGFWILIRERSGRASQAWAKSLQRGLLFYFIFLLGNHSCKNWGCFLVQNNSWIGYH